MYVDDPNPTGELPILLLHGLGTNSGSWHRQAVILVENGYRPIMPDLPGFGKSPNLIEGWSLTSVVEAIRQELDDRGIRSVIVVGLSLGGVIAQHFAVKHPERVQKLVLASTFATLWPVDLRQLFYFLTRFFLTVFLNKNAQAERVGKKIFPKPGQELLAMQLSQQIQQAHPLAYRSAMIELACHNLGDKLRNFTKLVLVIGGEEDTTVFIQRQYKLQQRIPNSRMVVIKGGGHGVAVDSPAEFNQHLLDFLSDQELENPAII